jgi:hypothetical protein
VHDGLQLSGSLPVIRLILTAIYPPFASLQPYPPHPIAGCPLSAVRCPSLLCLTPYRFPDHASCTSPSPAHLGSLSPPCPQLIPRASPDSICVIASFTDIVHRQTSDSYCTCRPESSQSGHITCLLLTTRLPSYIGGSVSRVRVGISFLKCPANAIPPVALQCRGCCAPPRHLPP